MDRIRTTHNDRRHYAGVLVGVVGFGSLAAAALAAVTLLVLMTNPATAAEVADRGSLVPVFQLLVRSVGHAIVTILKFL